MAIQVSWSAPHDNGAPIEGYQLWMSTGEEIYTLVYNGT
jgi:hypothetical protein